MKRADIPDAHVIELARAWQDAVRPFTLAMGRMLSGKPPSVLGVVEALMAEGIPEKLALRKVEHLEDRGLLESGTSSYYAWPA